MKEAYIFNGVRTPIGSLGGSLSFTRTDDLCALSIRNLMERNPRIDWEEVSDVIIGCANQSGEDNRNVARMALLLAGMPVSVPGQTVNRLCASGLSACADAARMIRTEEAELMVAGGVENMTRGPLVVSKASTAFGRDQQMYDSSFGWRFVNPIMKEKYGVDAMGETAENVAEKFKISREEQDKFSLWSQEKSAKAEKDGRLALEIVPVEIPQKKGNPTVFSKDEFAKPGTKMEVLSGLKPAFRKDGTVTAGNSSGLNDGSAAVLIGSDLAAKKYGITPLARMVSVGISGVEPRLMGIGPVEAANRALKKAGLQWKDIDLIELNEAFAAQSLACLKSWNFDFQDERVNPNGGAISLGHPLGMSGTRICLSAAISLHLSEKRFALVTMCIGVGQGYALILERA